MKYLYLLLMLFSLAAGATDPGSQYKHQAEAGDPRAQYYLADTYVSYGDISRPNTGRRNRPITVTGMRWRCWPS